MKQIHAFWIIAGTAYASAYFSALMPNMELSLAIAFVVYALVAVFVDSRTENGRPAIVRYSGYAALFSVAISPAFTTAALFGPYGPPGADGIDHFFARAVTGAWIGVPASVITGTWFAYVAIVVYPRKKTN